MNDPFIGLIQYFAINYAPKQYALCDGSLLNVNTNAAIYSLIGVTYGGQAGVNFNLPDLRGRAIIGWGQSAGSVYNIGAKGGQEQIVLPMSTLPVHTHTAPSMSIPASGDSGTGQNCTNAFFATPDAGDSLYASAPDGTNYLGAPSLVVSSAGASQPISVINPYVALTCCIALQGYYPPRNN